jgi:hypothetical protein
VRWLVCQPGPSFSVADVHAGWCEALRDLGQHVEEFTLADRLVFYDAAFIRDDAGEYKKALTPQAAVEHALNGLAAGLFKFRPHVLLVVSGFFTDTDLLEQARRTGTRVVLLMTESPYEEERQLKLAPHADLVLLNDPTNLAKYETLAPTVYAPHAYRRTVHCPGPTDEKPSDLVFVGTGYPSRIEFFEAMDLAGLDVALAGNWMRLDETSPLRGSVVHDINECFDNLDAVPLYRASRCGINFYRRESEENATAGWAMGPREVELAACGLFFLRDPRGEGDRILPMLPTFAGPEDAAEQLRWWLGHDDQRRDAATKAREAIHDRTFHHHAARLLRLLGVKE